MNNILVTGSDGQLGAEIKNISSDFPINFLFYNHSRLDITDYKAVENLLRTKNIDVIINCAAYTSVEMAESEPELAEIINHKAVANLAKLSKENNIKLVHISTDYVFDGFNHIPYIETDYTNPISVYGQTKLSGELALKRINPENSIIIRTSWLYAKKGNNFVNKIIKLAETRNQINVISDHFGSPTNALDLAKVIMNILPKIKNKSVEIYHYSNKGSCSWYEFALEIFKIKKIKTFINAVKNSEYQSNVKRPAYSVLDKEKIIKSFNIEIPFWKDSLRLTLKNF